MAARDQLGELAEHLPAHLHLIGLSVEGEHVPAQEQIAAEATLELTEDRVLGARELGGDRVVEGELATRQVVTRRAFRGPPR